MSLASLRQKVNINGDGISQRDKEEIQKWIGDGFTGKDSSDIVDLYSEQMTCFLFESVIRPSDKGLVIHLKHLPPALRNAKFFNYATSFIRDRVGKFGSLNASFIGEVDSVNKLNSLDLIFTDYYPAKLGDMNFIKRHTAKIGMELNDKLVKELGEHVIAINSKRR